jgi:hypothetical protein
MAHEYFSYAFDTDKEAYPDALFYKGLMKK